MKHAGNGTSSLCMVIIKPGLQTTILFYLLSCSFISWLSQMRYTRKMAVWPVGICGGLRWEGPVCAQGKVVDWHTSWAKDRPFPIDFAGESYPITLLVFVYVF